MMGAMQGMQCMVGDVLWVMAASAAPNADHVPVAIRHPETRHCPFWLHGETVRRDGQGSLALQCVT